MNIMTSQVLSKHYSLSASRLNEIELCCFADAVGYLLGVPKKETAQLEALRALIWAENWQNGQSLILGRVEEASFLQRVFGLPAGDLGRVSGSSQHTCNADFEAHILTTRNWTS